MIRGTARVEGGELRVEFAAPLPDLSPEPEAVAVFEASSADRMPKGKCAHSSDFSSVMWQGRTYMFTPKQRLVVAALWRAWEQGYDWVGTAALLDAAESEQQQVRRLFDNGRHPAWGTMIVPGHVAGGPLGSFRLAVPE